MVCTKKNCFSPEAIKRLALYLQNFKRLQQNGVLIVSSKQIAGLLHVTPEQFRKDLSYFGEFGKRGVGYQTELLVRVLEGILGLNKLWNVALVGVGRLGTALLNYQGFSELNVKIKAAFDIDQRKQGAKINGLAIQDLNKFADIVHQEKIQLCIISVPVDCAQNVADLIVEAGIKAILNFAPIVLQVPHDVFISDMNISSEIERLTFFLNQ